MTRESKAQEFQDYFVAMKFIITFVIFSHVTIGFAMAGGAEIAAAARTQIGLPYSWVSIILPIYYINHV